MPGVGDSPPAATSFAKSTKTARTPVKSLPGSCETKWVRFVCKSPMTSLQIRSAIAPVVPLKVTALGDGREFSVLLKNDTDRIAATSAVPEGIEVTQFTPVGSRGTIFCRELANWSPEEVNEQLSNSAMEAKPHPPAAPTPGRFLLFFVERQPPEQVTMKCGLILSVRPHAPLPLRCRKCLVYGHHERACNKKQRCPNCSQEGHRAEDCIRDSFCRACKEHHAVTDPACPTYLREKEVARIRASEGCSITSARKKAESSAPSSTAPQAAAPPVSNSLTKPHPASATGATRELFPPLPQRAPPSRTVPPPAPAPQQLQRDTQQQILALMTQQMTLLSTLVEQNKAIMSQNARILQLLAGNYGEPSPTQKDTKRKRKQSAANPSMPPGPQTAGGQHTILSLWKSQTENQPEEESTTNDEEGKN